MDDSLILVVEDDAGMRFALDECLKRRNYSTLLACDGQEAIEFFCNSSPNLVLLDLKIPKMSGMEVLERIKEISPETVIVILTGNATIDNAVEAMKKGAYDFITKPFEVEDLLNVVEKANNKGKIGKENLIAQNNVRANSSELYQADISVAARNLNQIIDSIAVSDSTTLIEGESGTGKSLIARQIHNQSDRRDKPFVKIDCASLSGNLIESELFGYEKGAFTGAASQKKGKIERANGGTLFLDEISTLDLNAQATLLNLIQNQEFERIGGNTLHSVDIRIIAASNQNLKEMVKEKAFRLDLFYRLNVFSIVMPPLRERVEDILPLAYFFINRLSQREGITLSTEVAIKIKTYQWPGNIRELENVMKHALILLGEDPIIEISHLPLELNQGYWAFRDLNLGLKGILETMEKNTIEQVLLENNLNIEECARALKMPVRTLYYRINKLEINLNSKNGQKKNSMI
ncbi:MAG: sigma-54 dependent transcriptional regulator [Bacillota bacterium]|nr:sigma-54 dependent transcriptional regulator [Bacillota bacterium]